MNSSNSKRVPLLKLFSKLRQFIAVVPEANAPYRSWDKASSREIQLEFDFEHRRRIGLKRLQIPVVAKAGREVKK
ncbi:hypothetical protein [Prosthecobacter sp.]|uniref:hypothetical protein n=1 Tax=Prosthecobacter sp. TaxID=1965333 RepID=UPI003782F7F7